MSGLVGKTFSHYEIRDQIGAGGMGVVYRAFDLHLERFVALKVLRDEFLQSQGGFQALRREALALSRLQHPNILAVYDYAQSDGHTFLCMELVEGSSLREMLAQGPLPLQQAADLTIQICDALAWAHSRGLVHRDIKPENVMVTPDGTVKLMDFGLAKSFTATEATKTLFMAGTVPYCSPECFDGADADQTRDIFALGVMLSELLTGVLPHGGGSPSQMIQSILSKPPVLPRSVSPALPIAIDSIVARCLEKDPSRRCRDANEIREALLPYGSARKATGALGPREDLGPQRATRRRGVLVAGAAALGVALVLAAVVPRILEKHRARTSSEPERVVALIPFSNDTGNIDLQWLSTGVPLMLFTNLSQFPEFRIMSLQRTEELVRSLGWSETDLKNTGAAVALAGRAGAAFVLRGRVDGEGESLSIIAELLDGKTGDVLVERRTEAARVDGLMESASDLGKDLAGFLGKQFVQPASASTPKSVPELATSSIEAFKYYALGEEAWYLWRHEEAVKYLDRAVATDSTFAMAHLRLFQALQWLEERERSAQSLERARVLSTRLPDRDRLLIEAYWFEGNSEFRESQAVLDTLTSRYPTFREAFALKGDVLDALYKSGSGSIEAAIAAYQEAVELDPDFPFGHNDLAYAYAHAKRYDEAIVALQKYAELSPGDPNPFDSMGEMYLHQGRFREALRDFDRALDVNPLYVMSLANATVVRVTMGEYDGAIRMADRLEESTRTPGMRARAKSLRASAYDYRGQERAAKREWEAELALRDRVTRGPVYVKLAALATLRGDYEEARRFLDAADSSASESEQGVLQHMRCLNGELFLMVCSGDTAFAAAKLDTIFAIASKRKDVYGLTYFHLAKATLAQAQGNPELACEEIQKSMDLLPQEPAEGPFRHGRRLALVDCLIDAGRLDEARTTLDSLMIETPNLLACRYLSARILQKRGDRNGARLELDQCATVLRFADKDSYRVRLLADARESLEKNDPIAAVSRTARRSRR